jgi:hypothetical protein
MSLEALLQHGWPTAALAILGLFLWKGIWPFLKGQIEVAQRENREAMAELVAVTKEISRDMAKMTRLLDEMDKRSRNAPTKTSGKAASKRTTS